MYHFIGIGGIGMSALARILLQRNEKVRGSDSRASSLLEELEREGAEIEIGHNSTRIQKEDTIVYSSGIREDNEELKRARELGLPLLHRSELLNLLIGTQKPLLVTGTHGKTTTSALLTSVLLEAACDPSFAVGGIMLKLNSNGHNGTGPYFVLEADESDGSFLKTFAFGAIVTNLGRDHLDFWKSEKNLSEGFSLFFQQVQNPKHLFWCGDDPALHLLKPPGLSYGFCSANDFQITNFRQDANGIVFDLNEYHAIRVALFGRHNALNSAAVFALALSLGIDEAIIRKALASFQGTQRRLERIAEVQKIEIFDDYGHHPTEISATLAALRAKVRERRIVALFQPHRYSRFSDLFDQFLSCFEEVDELVVTDIYGAGEEVAKISANDFVSKLRETWGEHVHFFPRNQLTEKSAQLLTVGDVVITLGAGDIVKTARELPQFLTEKRLTIGVLFGGASSEHEISCLSARNICAALDPTLYQVKSFYVRKDGSWGEAPKISQGVIEELAHCEALIPVFHGPRGEDGMMASLFELLNLPYVGCGPLAAAICMQKSWTKQIALQHSVPTSPFVEFNRARWSRERSQLKALVAQKLSYPVWVKAVHLGSSIGVSRAATEDQLEQAVELSFRYDECLIVEEEIIGREIEFAVLGNDFFRLGAPGEILSGGQFYDYENKYGPGAMNVQTPAALTVEEEQTGKALALTIYEACNCKGLARVDFFLDSAGRFWFNEINPMPGFTANSLYPKMWEAAGITQRELLNDLIFLALHRQRNRMK